MKNKLKKEFKNNFKIYRNNKVYNLDKLDNNFIMVGSSGSGKGYMFSAMLVDMLVNKDNVVIIDIGGTYRNFNKMIGGDYFDITKNTSINFLNNIQLNKKGKIKNLKFLIKIISSLGQVKDKNYQEVLSKIIYKNINNKFGMKEILNSLVKENKSKHVNYNKIIKNLSPYGKKDSKYFNLFNGESILDSKSNFVVYDLEDISNNSLVHEIATSIIIKHLETKFKKNKKKKKVLVLDEFWMLSDASILLKQLNKLNMDNLSIGLLTQSISDLKNFKKIDFGAEIYLQQSDDSLKNIKNNNLREKLHGIHRLKNNFLFIENGKEETYNFQINSKLHNIITHNPTDMRGFKEIMDEENVSELEARLIKAKKDS